jgi:hypothetical protein
MPKIRHIESVGRQNATSSSVNTPRHPMYQLLESQISAILGNSPCIGPSGTIEVGVPKAVAALMVEQIMQEFHAEWESLPEERIRANIQNKVEELKDYATEVMMIPLLVIGH